MDEKSQSRLHKSRQTPLDVLSEMGSEDEPIWIDKEVPSLHAGICFSLTDSVHDSKVTSQCESGYFMNESFIDNF